jgi:hypothetical protein
VVVRQYRGGLTALGSKIATCRAQVVRGRRRCVEDVERVPVSVAVAVGRIVRPRGRDELHRSDRAVIDQIAVEPAAVGVADERRADPVQRYPDDTRNRYAVAVQGRSGESAMVGFDAADRREQRPRQTARRVRPPRPDCCSPVRPESDGRDSIGGQT